MAKLLAVDLDGTLFYPKQLTRLIPKKNVKFLRDWIDCGNKVVLITSRSHLFTERAEKEIGRPVDSINFLGGQIWKDGKTIKDEPLKKDILMEALKRIDEEHETKGFLLGSNNPVSPLSNNAGLGKLFRTFYKVWYWFQGQYREKYLQSNEYFQEILEKENNYIARVLLGVKKKRKKNAKNLNKSLRNDFPELECSWTDLIIEITPNGCNKADALTYYIANSNIRKDDVYVVGDSGNDITMFQRFEKHSYCMWHSYPSVKKYAKNVIHRVHNLDKLLEGEKR